MDIGSEEEFRVALDDYFGSHPYQQEKRRLILDYAERQGGLEKQVLELVLANFWGRPVGLSYEQCAERLRITPQRVEEVIAGLREAILPELLKFRRAMGKKRDTGP